MSNNDDKKNKGPAIIFEDRTKPTDATTNDKQNRSSAASISKELTKMMLDEILKGSSPEYVARVLAFTYVSFCHAAIESCDFGDKPIQKMADFITEAEAEYIKQQRHLANAKQDLPETTKKKEEN